MVVDPKEVNEVFLQKINRPAMNCRQYKIRMKNKTETALIAIIIVITALFVANFYNSF